MANKSGRVEYLANQAKIEEMLLEGYSLKSIHTLLQEKGELKCLKYKTLCAYSKKGIQVRTIKGSQIVEPLGAEKEETSSDEQSTSEEKSLAQSETNNAGGHPTAPKDKPKQKKVSFEETDMDKKQIWEGE